jgi:hypothetical protein
MDLNMGNHHDNMARDSHHSTNHNDGDNTAIQQSSTESL